MNLTRVLNNKIYTIILFIFCGGFIGCQSSLDIEGGKHQIAIEKWRELSKYASSSLVQHNVFVAAKLSISFDGSEPSYQLTDITLKRYEDNFNLNLLAPSFNDKYICTPVCSQLIEYMSLDSGYGYTLLNKYIFKHEFELFDFYAEIYKLNQHVAILSEVNLELVDDFLYALVKENKRFNSLSDFTRDLRSKLSVDNFKKYIRNPQRFIKNDKNTNSLLLVEGEQWTHESGKESEEWKVKAETEESKKWEVGTEKESEQWVVGVGKESELWEIDAIEKLVFDDFIDIDEPNRWLETKDLPLSVNDLVCSYSLNIFGNVVSLNNRMVKVSLLGEAKIVKDGLIAKVEKGFLFNQSGDIPFLPLNGVKEIERKDLAVCFVK